MHVLRRFPPDRVLHPRRGLIEKQFGEVLRQTLYLGGFRDEGFGVCDQKDLRFTQARTMSRTVFGFAAFETCGQSLFQLLFACTLFTFKLQGGLKSSGLGV